MATSHRPPGRTDPSDPLSWSDLAIPLTEIVRLAFDAVVVVDEQLRVRAFGPDAEALFGYRAADVLGRPATMLAPASSQAELDASAAAFIASGDAVESGSRRAQVIVAHRADGSDLPVSVTVARAVSRDHGDDRLVAVFVTDLRARVALEEAAANAEARARTILDALPVGVVVQGADGAIQECNPSAERILGLTADQMAGRTSTDPRWQAIRPDGSPFPGDEHPAMLALRSGRDVDGVPMGVAKPDGSRTWIRVDARLIGGGEGLPGGVFTTFTDVTAALRADEEIRASERRLRKLLGSGWDMVAITDSSGIVRVMSDSVARILGYPAEKFADGSRLFALGPDAIGLAREAFAAALAAPGSVRNFETAFRAADGSMRWIEVSVADRTADPDIGGILLHARDLTAQHQAQTALAEMLELLEARVQERTAEVEDLYDNAPCGYHSLDENGRFVRINATELAWLGRSREDVIGHPLTEFITEESRAVMARSFPIFLERGWIRDLEFEFVRADGTTMPVIASASMATDDHGRRLHSRSTVFDNSARHAAEVALREANEALERALRTKDEFLASMSHELRTPLTGILGLAETLRAGLDGPVTPEQDDSLALLQESGHHLLDLINDVLDLAKVQAGQLELVVERLSAHAVCAASLELVKPQADRRDQQVSLSIEPRGLELDADERRLKQILVNLLSNAVKFTPDGGHVRVEVRGDPSAGSVAFSVVDDGIGIAPADQVRLFRPFTQVDARLSREHAGTGLGLALVARMADLHGGRVELESAPGAGSRFTVVLPWSMSGSAPLAGRPRRSDDGTGTALGGFPEGTALGVGEATAPLILLAEDSAVTSRVVAGYLRAHGYRVTVAHDGVEAVERAAAERPALILMDIQMPRMDGLAAIGMLRADPDGRFARTPIVALTALAMHGDRERCLAAGATEYFSKPVDLGALAGSLDVLLRTMPG